jgi:hypothetical protein
MILKLFTADYRAYTKRAADVVLGWHFSFQDMHFCIIHGVNLFSRLLRSRLHDERLLIIENNVHSSRQSFAGGIPTSSESRGVGERITLFWKTFWLILVMNIRPSGKNSLKLTENSWNFEKYL